MFGHPLVIQPCRICGKKGKRGITILILNQVKIDPANQVYVRAVFFYKLCNRAMVRFNFSGKYFMKRIPQCKKHLFMQIFPPGHQGNRFQQLREFLINKGYNNPAALFFYVRG